MKAPSFWWQSKASLLTTLLSPLGAFYGFLSTQIYKRRSRFQIKPPFPVISVGNLVLGGAGKTPVVLALVSLLRDMGQTPIILTRGYGGKQKGPLWVNTDHHTFLDVGDEALLLAQAAPTIVSAYRADALTLGPFQENTVWILDDAHTHASLSKDLSLVVVRPGQGFGNGYPFPAGPLREPLQSGLARADALVWLGGEEPLPSPTPHSLEILRASPRSRTSLRKGTKVWGFAGIGYPEGFRSTLKNLGLNLVGFDTFPDHHPYKTNDLKRLKQKADKAGALLVTTEKDRIRLPVPFKEQTQIITLEIDWHDRENVCAVLSATLFRRLNTS